MNAFDSANYPTREPTELVIGDRWMWKRSDLGSDYPPASYTLKYSLRLDSVGTEIEITATDSGTDFLIEIASAVTAAYTAGSYRWQAYITRNSDAQRITLNSGTVDIKANRDAVGTDPRGHARKVLDAIEAVIENRATQDQEEYSISNRSLRRTPIPDLLKLRTLYRQEVAAEEAAEKLAAGTGTARKIQVRF